MTTPIALIFDFDDVLVPDTTTYFLEEHGVDATTFWQDEFPARVQQGYDPTVAYLTLLLDYASADGEIGEIEPSDLNTVGQKLDDEVFDGFHEFMEDINGIVEEFPEIDIEWHAISEGIEGIITGTTLVDSFTSVSASRLGVNEDNVINHLKRPISFTDKTRYLFEINKGISTTEATENPYLVNRVGDDERDIPFENMIYVGDGLTDVPCFSLVKERGGRAFGVRDTENPSAKQEGIKELGAPERASQPSKPAYRQTDRLGSLLRLAVEGLCTNRSIDSLEAL